MIIAFYCFICLFKFCVCFQQPTVVNPFSDQGLSAGDRVVARLSHRELDELRQVFSNQLLHKHRNLDRSLASQDSTLTTLETIVQSSPVDGGGGEGAEGGGGVMSATAQAPLTACQQQAYMQLLKQQLTLMKVRGQLQEGQGQAGGQVSLTSCLPARTLTPGTL
jgi:hypothetical protein